MLYKALKTFTGLEKMRRGEVKELTDDFIIKDLLHAGYIEAVGSVEEPTVEPTTEEATEDAPTIEEAVEPVEAEAVETVEAVEVEPEKPTRRQRQPRKAKS